MDAHFSHFVGMIERYFSHEDYRKRYREAFDKGMYTFIPLPVTNFVDMVKWGVEEYFKHNPEKPCGAPFRFLDIGGGPGIKAWMAYDVIQAAVNGASYKYSVDARSLELDKGLAEISETLGIRTFNEDAFLFRDYRKYDILYFYRPLCNVDLQKKLERRIARLSKPGSIHIRVYPASQPRNLVSTDHSNGCIWMKPLAS